VKALVLNSINAAKTVFKAGDDTSVKHLQTAVSSTDAGLQDLLRALEQAAGVSNAASSSPAPANSTTSAPTASSGSSSDNAHNASPPSSPRTSKKDKATAAPAAESQSATSDRPSSPAVSRKDEEEKPVVPNPSDALSPKDASKQLQKEFSSRDPEKVFKVQDLLGEGASGSVYKAVHRETKKVVAIKKMQVGVNNITSTVKEIKIMKDLKSPYTLKYYGCYQKDDCIWIIMEFCDGGSVQDIIDARESEPACLSEAQISQISFQVLKALEYLHSMKKIHRDIKAGNILINGRGMAKLADFGISAQQVGDEKRTTTIGSSYWMAPETLMGGGYDSKADIWSLGITVMEMAEGIPPLIEEQPHKAAFRIVNDPPPKLTKPDQWTPIFNDFLSKCLVKNPDKRPTAGELLQHPFIKQSEGEAFPAILELLTWVDKHKKKRKKSSLKETILGSKQDVEEEANIDVYFNADTISNEKIHLLVPAHATVEDVLRQCSEQFKIAKDAKSYVLVLVVEEAPGKQKEKQLGMYDLPVKIYTHASKKYKKKDKNARDPVRFIYK
jgi:serine/threonine protein kinase